MKYRKLGKSGIEVSALGLGAMRLPGFDFKAEAYLEEKQDRAIKIAHRAFDLGVNYIDTAYNYSKGNNELIVGKILKGYREKVYLSTKSPVYWIKNKEDYRRFLDEQLKRLDVSYIDFYYFHCVDKNTWENIILKFDLLNEAEKAKQEGLIRHISISSHEGSEVVKTMLDTGIFETVLLQYNLLNREHEETIEYANQKDIGVVIMGPVAGGSLSAPSKVIIEASNKKFSSTPEVALRFVLANKNVSCMLSGMKTLKMVEQNAKLANNDYPLEEKDWNDINMAMNETKKLSDLYCTKCNYCSPCPAGINISYIFEQMIYHKVYGLTRLAKHELGAIGKYDWAGKLPSKCTECGACEKKCPQKIEIRKQIKSVISELY
jgi:predicted aldo/keto reductase-like oxidoreductase